MLSVQTLARRIRTRLHDTEEITYADEEILDCINCGIRFIRRTIAAMRPSLLMSETSGVLVAGEKSITLEIRPLKIINVLVKDKALTETEMAFAIHKPSDIKEEPKEFYLTGSQTINFYPAPTEAMPYTIRTVDDIEELTWEDKSPLLTEFDDFLIEYVTIRLSIGEEYDMTQESQLMANIVAQIQQLLIPPPAGIITRGYWL